MTGSAGSRAVWPEIGRRFYMRGWVMGTSGNFSAVVSREPFRLAITASSVHKGQLRAGDVLQCDEHGAAVGRTPGKPSAETLLHIEIARRREAGAVLHTHSVWTTVLSDFHVARAASRSKATRCSKGCTASDRTITAEWIPILANDQNMPRLAQRVGETLDRFPEAHAFLCAATVSTPGATRSRTPNGTSRFWSSCSRRLDARLRYCSSASRAR